MTDPVVAVLLEHLLPEMEAQLDAIVEPRLAAIAAALALPEPWMTTLDAARYLRLSPEALRARARRGTIPVHRDGQRFLFHRDELDSYLGWHGDPKGDYPEPRQLTNGPAQR
jgi:excisionase family DNA binding protein